MKNTFKRLVLLALLSVTQINAVEKKNIDLKLNEMRTKIEKLHVGFEFIFLKGDKEGHILLSQIKAIPCFEDESEIGKKLNVLIKELNAIFKTVHNIVTKYQGKGKGVLTKFLFEIGKSCNLEELFKKTISELEEIKRIFDSVNENDASQSELKAFIDFLKKIQPIWHEALLKKELIIKNLRESL
jgi:hypothetical protein